MFNIKDIAKYKTPENTLGKWGVIVEILKIESSVYEECNGIKVYRIKPLDETLNSQLVEEKNIIQCYSKYYEQNAWFIICR